MRARVVPLAVGLAVALAGCHHPRTEVVIGVATDLSATDQIDHVVLSVTRDQVEIVHNEWDISGQPAVPTELPGSFGVYTDDGSEPRIEVTVSGLHQSQQRVARHAIFNLVHEKTLFFRMALVNACVDNTSCDLSSTCVEGKCQPRSVSSRKFPDYQPGMELSVECQSGTVFVNTSTKQPMPTMGSGSCAPDEECTEGTCYKIETPDGGTDDGGGLGDGGLTGASGGVSTLAGGGGVGQMDGPGAQATFEGPRAVAFDKSGTLWVADSGSGISLIRTVAPDGTVTTIAGGPVGFADGMGANAQFGDTVSGLAPDPFSTDMFVVDATNFRVRRVSAAGLVSPFSGNGTASAVDGTGGPNGTGSYGGPVAIAGDGVSQLWVVDGNLIRHVDAMTGDVVFFAGNASAGDVDGLPDVARFSSPLGLAWGPLAHTLYVADTGNDQIRALDIMGNATTVAGSGQGGYLDGKGTAAQLNAPSSIAVDDLGRLFVADLANFRVRAVSPTGQVTTVAGTGIPGFRDGAPDQAQFLQLFGIAYDAGRLGLADQSTFRVRQLLDEEDLSPPWSAATDGPQTPDPTVTITAQSRESVTVRSVGGPGCGCNAQTLTIALPSQVSCSFGMLAFDYHTTGSFGPTSTASVEVELLLQGTSQGFVVGSEQSGPSQCALSAIDGDFPSPPLLVEGENVIDLSAITPTTGVRCGNAFDAVRIHLQGYGCTAADAHASTISSLRVYTKPLPAM